MSATEQTTEQLFEAETRQTPTVKRIIKMAAGVLGDIPVTVDEDGIHFLAYDPALVAMMDFRLKPELFDSFQAPTEPVQFMVEIDNLYDRVEVARKGEVLQFSLSEEVERGKEKTVLHTSISNGVTSTFSQEVEEADPSDVPETSDLEFSGTASVSLNDFCDAIDRMGKSIDFRLLSDRLLIQSERSSDRVEVEFRDVNNCIKGIAVEGEPHSCHAQDYLKRLKSVKQTANRVHLDMGEDFPVRLSLEEPTFDLAYIVAPRIDED